MVRVGEREGWWLVRREGMVASEDQEAAAVESISVAPHQADSLTLTHQIQARIDHSFI